MSGGLDSQLAVKVLQRAGAEVDAVCFCSPFFQAEKAEKAARALDVELRKLDFTEDILALIKAPPHGFGGAMNPCIDCHAAMIRRAGELMTTLGYDFVATGEVVGQRPMSQNRQSIVVVERSSGLRGRLVRPLSAKLLEPTEPELKGLLKREWLLDISGRSRDRQIALAAELGIVDYPAPAGGCKLTEAGFCRKLADLMAHEGLENLRLIELLKVGRRFRLPGGSGVILGRDQGENASLMAQTGLGVIISPVNAPGPTAVVTGPAGKEDMRLVEALVAAYTRCDRLAEGVRLSNGVEVPRPYSREPFVSMQIC